MLGRPADNRTDVDGYGHRLRNNLAYKGGRDIAKVDATKCDAAGDSFTQGLKITDKDFASLDEAELTQPRQPNGELPVMRFLHLADGSQLIDKGVETGFPFKGPKPDLGAFEK